jgi:hypothetical protein
MTTPVEHALARQLILEVYIDTTWTKVRFASEINPSIEPGLQDATTYDDNGWANQEKTTLAWTCEFTINLYRDAAGNYLPEAEYFRSAARVFGADGIVRVRWYDSLGGQEAHEGSAHVQWARAETAPDALGKATVTLTGQGPLLDITNPLAA